MSVKTDIYNAIKTSIQSKVTEIKTFAPWNNQIEHEKEEKPKWYPGCFVEFASMPWTQSNQTVPRLHTKGNISKEQKGTFDINIHLCFSQLENETISFTIIDSIIEKVYFAIQGLEGDYFTPLKRISEEQDSDHDRIIHWIMTFNCGVAQPGETDSTLTLIKAGTITPIISVDLDIDNEIIRTGNGK